MQLQLKSNYSNNQDLREKLYPLFDKVFGIEVDTFKDFYARGFWDPTYTPFTFFEVEKAVANVSMFEMPMMIHGKMQTVAGIQSVMTHPDYRGKGLMKSLFQQTLEHIDNHFELSFLLTSNPKLYEKYGFRVLREHYFVQKLSLPKQYHNPLVPLDVFNSSDAETIQSLFKKNVPSSQLFYPLAYESSFYLNMYNPTLHKMVHYSPDLNVLLIFRVNEGICELYDIVGPTMPTLKQLCSVIPDNFTELHLYISPDLFEENFTPVEYETSDFLMVRGEIDLENSLFKLPIPAAF
ncbi:GNAT family N-acetyltransferase [Ferdinandcohnia sp. Marseille-Q9671]